MPDYHGGRPTPQALPMDTPPTEFEDQLDDFLHLAGKQAITSPLPENMS